MADLSARRHLFFDLDDTLWDFEKNSSVVLQQLFGEFELEQKLKVGFEEFHSIYKNINHRLWMRYAQKDIDKAYLRNHRFNLVFNAFGYDNYAENLLMTQQYLQRAPHGRQLKEGCLDVLDYLHKNYTLHLITNGFREVQHIKLDNCGLRNYFSVILISEEHDLTKPDEKIFRLAEQLSGAARQDCVMIGDHLECDVQGALQAGWEAIYVSEENAAAHTGYVVNYLQQLKAFF